jgi:hypothetical protein
VTIIYDRAIPNVPGKSIRGVLVEHAHGGFSPAHIRPLWLALTLTRNFRLAKTSPYSSSR